MAGIVGLTTLQHQNATSAMTVDASGYLTASQPVLAKLRLTSDQTDLTQESYNKLKLDEAAIDTKSGFDNSNDLYIFVSQSGETADTYAALEKCKKNQVKTCGIVNVVESSIARMADFVLPIHAGPEIGVASTKAFIGQLIVLYLLTLKISKERNDIIDDEYLKLILDLKKLPELIEETLNKQKDIQLIARDFIEAKGTMYLGRGYSYPIAMEGALKLKELSYIHAEGYAAGEMKHGPLALIEDGMPVIVLAPPGALFDKTLST